MPSVALKLLVLKTPDVEANRSFYQSLGFEFVEERHGSGPLHYSASLGEGIIEIYPLSAGEDLDSTVRLGFSVSDPDAVMSQIIDTGGKVIKACKETPWGYMGIVSDPDGRIVELYRT